MIQRLAQRLRDFPGANPKVGVSLAEIEAVEAAAGLRLPDDLRSFYQTCNGVKFDDGGLEFPSLSGADQMRRTLEEMGVTRSWRYWPLTGENDADPICSCCAGPLRGYVVQVFHDLGPQLKWRSFEGFIEGTLDYISEDEWVLEFMEHEFAKPARSVQDVEAGRALLRSVASRAVGDAERGDACQFASWLLGDDQWAEVSCLLETEDEYVCRDICDRLKAMRHLGAKGALRDYKGRFRAFVLRCGELLTREGFRANVDEHSQLQVLDGPIWLNMEMLFADRSRPDLDRFLVERTKQLVDLHHKRS